MKISTFLLFIIFQTVAAQKEDEVIIHFNKQYPGNVYKDTTQQDKVTYYIHYRYIQEYIVLDVKNSNERIENKSFLRKANVIKVSEILKIEPSTAIKLFENKKVYIINPQKSKKKKFVLQEVNTSVDFDQM